MEAVRIDRAPTLAGNAFVVPDSAAQLPASPPPKALRFEPEAALRRLAGGDPELVAASLLPGFRPPLPTAPAH